MSSAISSILGSSNRAGDLSVVSAVVDGISAPGIRAGSLPGLSILCGSRSLLLPDLAPASPSRRHDPVETPGMLSFRFADGQRRVTLALANTVFQNGRTSTLFTSNWLANDGRLRLAKETSRQALHINLPCGASGPFVYSVPLIPITAPRKIVSGFGNILRQIDVAGTPSPASQELEAILPGIMAMRTRTGADQVRVWALVMPVGLQDIGTPALQADIKPEDELKIARQTSPILSRLLNAGCRLQQIR